MNPVNIPIVSDHAIHLENGLWWVNPAPGRYEAGEVDVDAWDVNGCRYRKSA